MVEPIKNNPRDPVDIEVYQIPADQVVGLYLGISKAENLEALGLARQAGFIVSIVPTLPGTHPELMYKGGEYYGMEAIRKVLTTSQPQSDPEDLSS